MKIIILNYYQTCVDVLKVSDDERKEYGWDDFNDIGYLCDHGYSPNEIHWMCYDDEPDGVPVFLNNEQEPYTIL